MGLLERIRADVGQPARNSIDYWLENYLIPAQTQFQYNGQSYFTGLNTTMPGNKVREIATSLPSYFSALRQSPPAFAAQMVRALVLSQARFTFRNRLDAPIPRRVFGTTALRRLEQPWPNGTTGELLTRMEWHAGLAGNSFVARQPTRLRVLRPDWTGIVWGSQREPEDPGHAIDGELLGYVYQNGGFLSNYKAVTLLPEDVAHWSPLPDPMSPGLGMSWLTPGLRDIQGDRAMTEHKLMFFTNGATPNLVVKGIVASDKKQFDDIVDGMEAKHKGLANAYKTLYLTSGADATVVGANLQQADLKSAQGGGETRIAMLSRVPAAILQIAEGLAGSSLNAGNFGMSRRIFADSWVYPELQDVCRALAPITDVPADAELWFDVVDMPLLREDAKDAAEIESVKATTITNLVKEGFTPQSAIDAVLGQNMRLLKHSGLVSVQLQPPMIKVPGFADPASVPKPALPAAPAVPALPAPADTTPKPQPPAKPANAGKGKRSLQREAARNAASPKEQARDREMQLAGIDDRGREPDAPREPAGQFAPGGGGGKLGATSPWIHGTGETTQQDSWWEDQTHGSSSEHKHAVVSMLTGASGLTYDRTNELVAAWATTSSNNHADALAIQEAVANKFGVPVGKELKGRIAKEAASTQPHYSPLSWHSPGELPSATDWTSRQADAAKFVGAMYDKTQAELKAGGITEMYLSRGMHFESGDPVPKALKEVEAGGYQAKDIAVRMHPASSWSTDQSTAMGFAFGNHGFVLTARVPANRVLSTPFTGVGCLHESEVVIVGGTKLPVHGMKI